eukprot:m.33347 g.33347  ORF g.33347 m.33347 type:complete len:284 (+) comp12225_c0_seq1:25-876(+)
MAQRLARFRALARQHQQIRQLSRNMQLRQTTATITNTDMDAHVARTIPSGLFKFFPDGEQPNVVGSIFSDYKVGRRWLARDLRMKSDEDLHKLWYVLLMEKNKLLTIKHECKRQGYLIPRPDRFRKVRKSMEALKFVVREREVARKQAAEFHPEDLQRIRAGSGVPEEWFAPKPKRLPLREKEAVELLGVVPPNRPRPGQKMRPMSKREKTKFRTALRLARQRADREDAASYATKLKAMTDDQVMIEFRGVVDELLTGADIKSITRRSKKCLAEARERGLSPV